MEHTLRILIYIHAFLGGLGLFTGMLAILARKGNRLHRNSGKIFVVSMSLSAVLSILIAASPGHRNPFLLLIGIFTLYLLGTGYRAIRFVASNKRKASTADWIISACMAALALGMIALGLSDAIGTQVLFVFFGIVGLFLTIGDFRTFRNERGVNWLSVHISKIVGALIASVTAFLVAGLDINHVAAWIAPTIIGTLYIIRWQRRIRTN